MEKFLKIGKVMVWLTLVGPFAILPLICLLNFILVLGRGGPDDVGYHLTILIGVSAICGGILGMIFMVVYRAGKSGEHVEPSKGPQPGPDGDMSDVAGVPRRDPWQGL